MSLPGAATEPFRVLALDGGGIRGLYTAVLLQQLALRVARFNRSPTEERLDLGQRFDLVAGTSTGAILAAALASGASLERVVSLYRDKGKRIFQRPMPLKMDCWSNRVQNFFWIGKTVGRPANSSDALREALTEVLGSENLADLYRRRHIGLCVPAVDAENRQGWVFKTPHAGRLTRDDKYLVVDVCMASAAAPVYFPLHRVASPNAGSTAVHSFADGGLWANNPVMVALVEALELAPDRQIEILSVGTCSGKQSRPISGKEAHRGSWAWKGGAEVVSTSLDAQAFTTPYIAKQVVKALGGRVTLHRLLDPAPSSDEGKHLALDAVDSTSLTVLEMLAHRAADLNISDLTTSTLTPERQMALSLFSNLQQLP